MAHLLSFFGLIFHDIIGKAIYAILRRGTYIAQFFDPRTTFIFLISILTSVDRHNMALLEINLEEVRIAEEEFPFE